MKSIVKAADLFKENEYEIIFLPESLCEEIDEAIKQTEEYHNREDFVSKAIDKFLSDVLEFFKKDCEDQ